MFTNTRRLLALVASIVISQSACTNYIYLKDIDLTKEGVALQDKLSNIYTGEYYYGISLTPPFAKNEGWLVDQSWDDKYKKVLNDISVTIEFAIVDGEGRNIVFEKGNITSSNLWHLTNYSPTNKSVASIYNSGSFVLQYTETYKLMLRVLSSNIASGGYDPKLFLTPVPRVSSP